MDLEKRVAKLERDILAFAVVTGILFVAVFATGFFYGTSSPKTISVDQVDTKLLRIIDDFGESRITARASEDQPFIAIQKQGRPAVILWQTKQLGFLSVYDENGNPRSQVGYTIGKGSTLNTSSTHSNLAR